MVAGGSELPREVGVVYPVAGLGVFQCWLGVVRSENGVEWNEGTILEVPEGRWLQEWRLGQVNVARVGWVG